VELSGLVVHLCGSACSVQREWVKVLRDNSNPSCAVTARLSCVMALKHAGQDVLLNSNHNKASESNECALQLWAVLVTLLGDEDDQVRDIACSLVNRVSTSSDSNQLCHQEAARACFDHMSQRYGRDPALLQLLCDIVCPGGTTSVVTSVQAKLFADSQANSYGEDALVSSMAAACLHQVLLREAPTSDAKAALARRFRTTADMLEQQLRAVGSLIHRSKDDDPSRLLVAADFCHDPAVFSVLLQSALLCVALWPFVPAELSQTAAAAAAAAVDAEVLHVIVPPCVSALLAQLASPRNPPALDLSLECVW
jgi:hypothetical protein